LVELLPQLIPADIGVRIKGDERLLGSSDFVQRVLKQAEAQLEDKYRLQRKVISLPALIDKVVHCYKIDPDNLKSSSTGKIEKWNGRPYFPIFLMSWVFKLRR